MRRNGADGLIKAGVLVGLVMSLIFPAPVQAAQAGILAYSDSNLSSPAPCSPGNVCGIYTGDAYGPLHPVAQSPVLDNYPVFRSPVVRAVRPAPSQQQIDENTPVVYPPYTGYVLDGFGGLHPYSGNGSAALTPLVYPYFPGKDIARDLAFDLYRNGGGYILDGYGGIHPFSDTLGNLGARPLPGAPTQYAYFRGHDVAIKILLIQNGGYVLDAYGGIHPFGSSVLPVAPSNYPYWPNARMARDFWIAPSSNATSVSGYVLDAYGGIHPFWGGTASAPPPAITQHPYFAGHDIARAMVITDTGFLHGDGRVAGYELDGYGGIHPFASAASSLPAAVTNYAYSPGRDTAKALVGNLIPPS